MPPTYLLDTGVILLLARGGESARRLDAEFGLRGSPFRPLVCSVSIGELWALAEMKDYGIEKRRVMQQAIENAVIVDINDPLVVAGYVEVYKALRGHPGGSRIIGQNDMWIAAATRAADATLLTLDHDFDPLHPRTIQRALKPPVASTTKSRGDA